MKTPKNSALLGLGMLLAALSGGYLLSACNMPSTVIDVFMPRHFFYSRVEIQKKIDERWHFDKKVLQLFEVKIASPSIQLLPESNRLKCAFHLTVRRPFSSSVIEGTLTVAGKLQFDASRRTIQLVNTKVEAIDAEGMAVHDPLVQTISTLFGGTLTDIPLYELKPEDLRYAGVQFDPVKFTVHADGVDIELEAREKHQTQVQSNY